MPVTSADDLFLKELHDIYSAEKQLEQALPKLAEAATNEALQEAFNDHLEQTRGQIERLDQILEMLDEQRSDETCEAMQGLIKEAEEVIAEVETPEVLDAALIAAAQKVEHYEIASYGTLRSLAESMGLDKAAAMLSETLQEEEDTDARLTDIAETEVNLRMLRMDGDDEDADEEELA